VITQRQFIHALRQMSDLHPNAVIVSAGWLPQKADIASAKLIWQLRWMLPTVWFQDVRALRSRSFKNRFIGGFVDDPDSRFR
jgi:hypothetical protein